MNHFTTAYSTDQDDQSLIEQAIKGNRNALENLLKKHQPYIYNIAWKMVQMPDDAQDITQEVMVKVITNLSKFRGESEFRTWLYRIVTNHFLQMKKQKRETLVNEDFDAFTERLTGLPDVEITLIEIEEKAVEIREMNMACMSGMLLCLTREQRLVYILGSLFNADHTVGADILGISKGNFRVRLSRAKKDLFNFMNNQCGLVNKSNPCRCHKKVTAVVENQILDSKNLLFNREEYASFQNYIGDSPENLSDLMEEKVLALHSQLPYNDTFDKKEFLNDFISDERVISLLNLN
ncbi:RNA polymerase sigma factor [Roseivirga sp.]|uniref:RNA polymerase sigma factor n=1 Tax=Roseivirga sp. TaxID=1964215 RepID=UPI003B8D9428